MGGWRSGGWLHGIMACINKIDIKKMYGSPRYVNVSTLNQHTTKKKGCHFYLALLHISVTSTNHIWKELLWLVFMGYSIWGMASLRCCLHVFDFFLHLNSHVWPMGTGSLYCHLFVSKHVNMNCHADTWTYKYAMNHSKQANYSSSNSKTCVHLVSYYLPLERCVWLNR